MSVYDTQRGTFCVSPKSQQLCKSKTETGDVPVRGASVSTPTIKGNGLSEVHGVGKPPGPQLETAKPWGQRGRELAHSPTEATSLWLRFRM